MLPMPPVARRAFIHKGLRLAVFVIVVALDALDALVLLVARIARAYLDPRP